MISVNYNKTLLLGKRIKIVNHSSVPSKEVIGVVKDICLWSDQDYFELYLDNIEDNAFEDGWVIVSNLVDISIL